MLGFISLKYDLVNMFCSAFKAQCLETREVHIEMTKLDSSHTCERKCSKGVCQFKDAAIYASGAPFLLVTERESV